MASWGPQVGMGGGGFHDHNDPWPSQKAGSCVFLLFAFSFCSRVKAFGLAHALPID
jgi:hypothetical protein